MRRTGAPPLEARSTGLPGDGRPPLAVGATAAMVAASVLVAALELGLGYSPDRAERDFLAAADAVRTALASYWWKTAAAGAAHLPSTLTELGADAVPPDPWTGVADWGTVRNPAGEIIGIYSRSGHAVRNDQRLASLAERRGDLPANDAAVLGVSAWTFRWEPPVLTAKGRSAAHPSALAALEGHWPSAQGALALVASERSVVRDRLVLSEPTRTPRNMKYLLPALFQSGEAGAAPVTRRDPLALAMEPATVVSSEGGATSREAPWSVYVPIGQVPAADAGSPDADGSALTNSTLLAFSGAVSGAQDDSIDAPPPKVSDDPVAATVDAEFQYSTDPRTRRCQLSLSASNPRQVCRASVDSDDNGLAYDDCVRDLEARVAHCAQGR
jgi:hypothetical protein